MRVFICLLALLVAGVAWADYVNPTDASSAGGAFVNSKGDARAVNFAGIKTVHAVVPRNGFGNTINTSDGSCTFNPSMNWTYTKRVQTISWTTNFFGFIRGRSMPDKQAIVISENYANYTPYDGTNVNYPCSDSISDGHGGTNAYIGYISFLPPLACGAIYLCVYDASGNTNYPATPASGSYNFATNQLDKYYNYFNVSGTSLSAASYTEGSVSVSIPANVDPYNALHSWGYSNSTNHDSWNDVTLTNLFQIQTNYTATNWTVSSSGVWQGSVAEEGYPAVQACTLGDANSIYGTKTMTYTMTITYSDPVSLSDLEAINQANLDKVNLNNRWESYQYFDKDTCPVLLQWNPIIARTNGNFLRTIYRADVSGGTTNAYSLIDNSGVTYPPFWQYQQEYVDYNAKLGSNYLYRIQYQFFSPSAFYRSTNYCSVPNYQTNPIIAPDFSNEYSYTNQLDLTNVVLNLKATPQFYRLNWTSFGGGIFKNVELAVFPTSNNFVISSNVNCKSDGTNFFLAARVQPVSSGPVAFGVSGVVGWYSSKSVGYLPGNTNGPPKGTIFQEELYYTNSPFVGSNSYAITTNYLAPDGYSFKFPRGVGLGVSNWWWQLSRKYEFTPSNCPDYGYIYYR